jgi:hypothetical protein
VCARKTAKRCGKPILERSVSRADSMLYAFKMGLLAFDATRLCAADVGFPIDVLLYQRNSFELVEQRYHADELQSISNWWQERMHRSVRTCRPSGSKRRSLGSPVRKGRPENFGSALYHLPLRRAGLPGAAHAAAPSARRCLAAVGDVFVEDRAVPRRHHGVAGSGGNAAALAWFAGAVEELRIHSAFKVETLRENPFDYILPSSDLFSLPLNYGEPLRSALSACTQFSGPDEVRQFATALAAANGGLTLDFLSGLTKARLSLPRRRCGTLADPEATSRCCSPPAAAAWAFRLASSAATKSAAEFSSMLTCMPGQRCIWKAASGAGTIRRAVSR